MNPLNQRKALKPQTIGDRMGTRIRNPRLEEMRRNRHHHSGIVQSLLRRLDVVHLFAERLHALDGKGEMRDMDPDRLEGVCFGRLHALDGKGHRDQTLEEAYKRLDALEGKTPSALAVLKDTIRERIARLDGGPIEGDTESFWARLDALDGKGTRASAKSALKRLDALDRKRGTG